MASPTINNVGTLSTLLDNLSPDSDVKGKQFEHICKWFLMNDPVYVRQLRRVWLWNEWPGRWGSDAGIDLVAEEHAGRLWAIQAKAYDPAYSVTKTDVDSFLSESARPEFTFRLLIATTDRIGRTAERTLQAQAIPASRLLLGELQAAQVSWPRSVGDLKPIKRQPKSPRPHQREAIRSVVDGFDTASRGQLIMACGTGKTLTALFIAQRLAAKRTLVLVPSLSLLSDTLREWTANAEDFDFLPVCSDDTVRGDDAAVSKTADLGFPVTTSPLEIAAFLRRRSASLVVFATYQSSPRIAEAFRLGRVPAFDLVIADEAHRCAGRISSDFATVLDSESIPARRRLFMTATPRFFTGRVVQEAREAEFEVASMDDESRFGPVFHRLGFSEAIERGLLTDYQVAIVGVDDATYLDWAERGRFVTTDGETATDARTVAGQIGLAKAIQRYNLRRTISFHSRVSGARQFANSMPNLVDWMPVRQRPSGKLWSKYASGEMSAGERSVLLDHLRNLYDDERGLLANARCLGEGVDVPALDGVAFIDPRRSEVDIVQAVGRAIRLAEDKKIGTVVIPVFIEVGSNPEVALNTSAFKPVWDVIKALRAHDDELGEQLDELRRELGLGKKRLQMPTKIRLDLPARIGTDFASAFDVHLVQQTTASWEFWLGLLQRFVEREGHAQVPARSVEDGYRLGQWVGVQRSDKSKRRLALDRERRLKALPGWSWDLFTDQWDESFRLLRQFVEREGHARVPQRYVEDAFRLGHWVGKQRSEHTRGKVSPDRERRLEVLPGWSWDPFTDKWEEGFRLLCQFTGREGHARVPASNVKDGFRLGDWVGRQRNDHALGRLALDREDRLEALPGWTWDVLAEQWEEDFSLLSRFVEREGHSRVPQKHVEDRFRLGQWVRTLRSAQAKGQLPRNLVFRLEALPGWSWNTRADKWEERLGLLNKFVEREGHARVPSNSVENGYRLGRWVIEQRGDHALGRLTLDRVAQLEALPGWSWDALAAKWGEGFGHLRRFAQREGHTRVPASNVEDGYRLGNWVNKQRSEHIKGKLAPDREHHLEALPGWTWDVLTDQWEEGFRFLHLFVNREGHARVPQRFVEDGYQLGQWVNIQRTEHAKGKLAQHRATRLEALHGWVWPTKQSKY
jgi:superfamily II DNA or RNA helicase